MNIILTEQQLNIVISSILNEKYEDRDVNPNYFDKNDEPNVTDNSEFAVPFPGKKRIGEPDIKTPEIDEPEEKPRKKHPQEIEPKTIEFATNLIHKLNNKELYFDEIESPLITAMIKDHIVKFYEETKSKKWHRDSTAYDTGSFGFNDETKHKTGILITNTFKENPHTFLTYLNNILEKYNSYLTDENIKRNHASLVNNYYGITRIPGLDQNDKGQYIYLNVKDDDKNIIEIPDNKFKTAKEALDYAKEHNFKHYSLGRARY